MNVYVSMYVKILLWNKWLPIYVRLSFIYLSIYLSIYLNLFLSIYLSIYLSINKETYYLHQFQNKQKFKFISDQKNQFKNIFSTLIGNQVFIKDLI